MTLEEFRATLKHDEPPRVSGPLVALWWDAKGDWDQAHRVAQDVDDANGAWVHAYLDRKEGDAGNAAYWYTRARQPVATDALESEWSKVVAALLGGTNPDA